VYDLSKVVLDSAAAGIELAMSSRKFNAVSTATKASTTQNESDSSLFCEPPCLYVVVIFIVADEQFLLNRLANSAVDIYSMVVVLSRASRALEQNLLSARHESMLAKVICDEVLLLALM